MPVQDLIHSVPLYVLAFFRIAGLCIFAPLFGSSRIPRRIKALMVAMLTVAMVAGIDGAGVVLPDSPWELALGIGGELAFGLAIGLVLSLVFIAVQWAGEVIGQQMGLNLGEVFDPQFGQAGSLVGDLYFMLALEVFLLIRGHHAMLLGVRASFDSLPLLAITIDQSLVDLLVGMLQSASMLAMQLAAPVLVTTLVIDLALGLLSKTMPQFNVMSAGLSLRAGVGMVVLIFSLVMTSGVMREAMLDSFDQARAAWAGQSDVETAGRPKLLPSREFDQDYAIGSPGGSPSRTG